MIKIYRRLLSFFFILGLILFNQSCTQSNTSSKPKDQNTLSKGSVDFKELDSYKNAGCLFDVFKGTASVQNDYHLLDNIRDLRIGYECIVHISKEKVLELETNFQNHDILLSRLKINSISEQVCGNGTKSLKISTDKKSEALHKVFIYGIKPKKKYKQLSCD